MCLQTRAGLSPARRLWAVLSYLLKVLYSTRIDSPRLRQISWVGLIFFLMGHRSWCMVVRAMVVSSAFRQLFLLSSILGSKQDCISWPPLIVGQCLATSSGQRVEWNPKSLLGQNSELLMKEHPSFLLHLAQLLVMFVMVVAWVSLYAWDPEWPYE